MSLISLIPSVRGSPFYVFGTLLLVTALIKRVVQRRAQNPRGLPSPPGPKGYPAIGCLTTMPRENQWIVFDEWSKTYGDLLYFEVVGQPFLILGSLNRTSDIFEKRSAIYSDRPKMPMIVDLMGWDFVFGFAPYGQRWKKHRQAFHEHFNPTAVTQYRPIQIEETHKFLKRILEQPDDFLKHIRHILAGIIQRIAYGMKVESLDDPVVKNAELALAGVAEAGIPGRFLVDLIPALKYVPEWFPGASFQRQARVWRETNMKSAEVPYNAVKEQMRNGTAVSSIATTLIDRLPKKGDPSREEEELFAKQVSAVAYLGAADTTNAALQTFFLSMLIHPEVAKKAQEELDRVVGCNRLPDYSDRPLLPYVNAVMKEVGRWNVGPNLGIAHMSSKDDEYDGYFIPKGTVVMGNAWSILHDPEAFEDPEAFIPERYLKDGQLNPDVRSPSCAAFGWGRRVCPGQHLSQDSLFMVIASTLAVFDILPSLDDNGRPIKPEAKFSSELLSHPVPFKCRIVPRSPERASLIPDLI